MKISYKVILVVGAASLFFGLILSYFTFYLTRSALQENLSVSQTRLARQLALQMDTLLYQGLKEMQIVGSLGEATDILLGQNKGVDAFIGHLNEIIYNSGNWKVVYLVDAKGTIVASSNQAEIGKKIADSQEDSVAFLAASKGGAYVSDVIFSQDGKSVVVFAYPVWNADAVGRPVIGVIIGHYNWLLVSDILDTVKGKFVSIISRDGTLLAINSIEHLFSGSRIDSSSLGKNIQRPDLVKALESPSYSGIFPGLSTPERSLFAFVDEQGYLEYKGQGWAVAIEDPESRVFASAVVSAYEIAGIVLVTIIILAAILLLLLSTQILKPIQDLTRATQDIIKGGFSRKVKVNSNDELGKLGLAFNRMTTELSESYRDLEDKVKSRTEDLSSKNEKLNKSQKATLNLMEDLNVEKNNIAQEKNKINAILHSIGDGVFVVDRGLRIIVFNDVAAKISGFSPKEALGQEMKNVLKFVYEKDDTINDKFISEAISTGEIKAMSNHTLLVRKDGSRVPVADSAAPLKDENGEISGCVVVFRDVTREREVDQMKSEFVSVASHQLRTPLTGIRWLTELLQKQKLPKAAKEYTEQIIVSNDRMVHLVNDLLDVSRIETGRKFDVVLKERDIVPIVDEIIKEQAIDAKKKHITITCDPSAPKSLMLDIDELKIRQVFGNLISNAIKYSKENTSVLLNCHMKDGEVEFFVKDQGIGIPKEQQSKLFQKFFRADNASSLHVDGTGLGLYIAKAIVEAHGGKMWFESVEGKGSTFYFSLPRKAASGK